MKITQHWKIVLSFKLSLDYHYYKCRFVCRSFAVFVCVCLRRLCFFGLFLLSLFKYIYIYILLHAHSFSFFFFCLFTNLTYPTCFSQERAFFFPPFTIAKLGLFVVVYSNGIATSLQKLKNESLKPRELFFFYSPFKINFFF